MNPPPGAGPENPESFLFRADEVIESRFVEPAATPPAAPRRGGLATRQELRATRPCHGEGEGAPELNRASPESSTKMGFQRQA
jgi:hypothetical protein